VKRIIAVGHAALDHVWRIESYPPRPTKIRAIEHVEGGGGMAANAAAAIGRLGGTVELWSRVGDDEAGKKVRTFLEADKVNTTYVRSFKDEPTSCSAVLVDAKGERLAVGTRDLHLPTDSAWLPLDRIAGAGAILSDYRWLEGALTAFARARDDGVPTVADADFENGPLLKELLSLTDYAIFPAGSLAAFAPDVTEAEALARVLDFGPRYAGVTLGPKGYLWASRNGTGEIPAFEIDAVDTTGAGDAFHGAFTWALTQGFDEVACARFASAAAALKCRKLGARAALPTLPEVEDFLSMGRPRRRDG
jgi:sulfofructose kinase